MWMDSMITAEEARNRIRSIREERERKRLETEQRAKEGETLAETAKRVKQENDELMRFFMSDILD